MQLLQAIMQIKMVAGAIARLNVKIVVPSKYLSNFFRSREMP